MPRFKALSSFENSVRPKETASSVFLEEQAALNFRAMVRRSEMVRRLMRRFFSSAFIFLIEFRRFANDVSPVKQVIVGQ